MDAWGIAGITLVAWVLISVPFAFVMGQVIKHGHDGEP